MFSTPLRPYMVPVKPAIIVVLKIEKREPNFSLVTHAAARLDLTDWGEHIGLVTFRTLIAEAKRIGAAYGVTLKFAAIVRADKLIDWAAKRGAYIQF